ncbi:MAG TPA: hypothetical protein VFD85_10760 [Gemmatimonadales bacterium]|nr:hypothetical protein [Gemmatimonadales bacterium]
MKTLLLLALVAAPATGQSPLRLVATADTVLVYVLNAPARSPGGFVVYRRLVSPASMSFERRPLSGPTAATGPAELAGRLGSDLPMAMRAVRAADDQELFRRLTGDPFAAGVLSLVSRNAALALGRLYLDGGVTRNADYEYRVVYLGADGKETARALTGRVHVTDVVPATPTGPRVAGSDHEIRISWRYPVYQGAPTDFTVGFHVYRAEGTGTAQPRRITATPVLRNDANGAEFSFVDRDVATGTYAYQVSAVDLAGRESPLTAALAARTVDRTAPAIPVDLAVKNGDGVVEVTWRLAPELDAAGYHVERSAGLHQPYTRLNRVLIPVRRPIWTDTVPRGGRQYFYRVIAVDSAGNSSAPSNPVAGLPADKTPPPPVTALTLTTAQHRITAHWAPSPARDLRGYYVYHGEGASRVRLTGRPITAPQFVDSGTAQRGLTPGGRYVIRVSVVDSSYNESPGVEASITVPDDQPPAPPSTFSASNVAGRYVQVSWSASASRDVQAYTVTRSGDPSDTGARAAHRLPASARAWRDTVVVHGHHYSYRIAATDSAGNASAILKDSVYFRDLVGPPPPRAAGARALARGVEIRWERVVSPELAGYHVYRATLPTGTYHRLTRTPISLLVFTDSTGRAGLYYTVRAVDQSGNESRSSPVAPVAPR